MLKLAILDDYLNCALDLAGWDGLRDRIEITHFTRPLEPGEVENRLAPFDILCLMRDRTPFPRTLIERLPKLKFVTYTATSNLVFDGEAAAEQGILVSNTSSPAGQQEHFEFIWALLMATVRNIPAIDRGMREGDWQTGFGHALHGQTIGIVGLGNFGSMVARMAAQFGMKVLAWSENLTDERAIACGAKRVGFHELLVQSDVVTVHLRLSDRTRGLFGPTQFAAMKRGSVFLNVSRGPIVDEQALIEALAAGRPTRAGLDVFEEEPLPAAHPLRRLPNVVLSPHMGFITERLLRTFYQQTVENVDAWLNDSPIRVVDADIIAGRKPSPN